MCCSAPAESCFPEQLSAFGHSVPACFGGSLASCQLSTAPGCILVVSQRLGLPSCITPGLSRAVLRAPRGGEQSSAQVGGTGLLLNPGLPEDWVPALTHPCADFMSSRCCWRCCKSGAQEGTSRGSSGTCWVLLSRAISAFSTCLLSPFFLQSHVICSLYQFLSSTFSLYSDAALHLPADYSYALEEICCRDLK